MPNFVSGRAGVIPRSVIVSIMWNKLRSCLRVKRRFTTEDAMERMLLKVLGLIIESG